MPMTREQLTEWALAHGFSATHNPDVLACPFTTGDGRAVRMRMSFQQRNFRLDLVEAVTGRTQRVGGCYYSQAAMDPELEVPRGCGLTSAFLIKVSAGMVIPWLEHARAKIEGVFVPPRREPSGNDGSENGEPPEDGEGMPCP